MKQKLKIPSLLQKEIELDLKIYRQNKKETSKQNNFKRNKINERWVWWQNEQS